MRIGIIGLGSIGQRHRANLLGMGVHELLCVDPAVPGYQLSVDDLWAWKPEAVLICTPPETHCDLALEAFRRGAHVFCEKPLATRPSDALAVRDAARSAGKCLAVGYQLRWQLQNCVRFHAGRSLVWNVAQNMRQWSSQYQKDALLEFSHELDAALYANGPVDAVSAIEEPDGWLLKLRHVDCVSTVEIWPTSTERFRDCYDGPDCVWKFSDEQNDQAYKTEVQAFLDVCQDKPWPRELCSGAEAAHVVKIIQAAKQSARNSEVVSL